MGPVRTGDLNDECYEDKMVGIFCRQAASLSRESCWVRLKG